MTFFSFSSKTNLKNIFLMVLMIGIVGTVTISSANVFAFVPIQIPNPTPTISESFGLSVANDENYLVIGTPYGVVGSSTTGIAYLYDDTGVLQLTFQNPTLGSGDEFGRSVDVDGNYVVIGASSDDTGSTDAGIAYLFNITTCDADLSNGGLEGDNICEAATQTFLNPTPSPTDQFGWAVSISGNNIVIGSPLDDTNGPDGGSAYLYNVSGTLLYTLDSFSSESNRNFGSSVSISGNNIVIGAPDSDAIVVDAGEALLYDATTGNLVNYFYNPTAAGGDDFGSSVSISGNYVLIGAPLDDAVYSDAGAAYLFDTYGVLLHTFQSPAPALDDQFGRSVSVYGNNALVGVPGDNTGINDAGAAYLFETTTGTLLNNFQKPVTSQDDQFGDSVDIFKNHVLVGVWLDDTGAQNAGAAYLFDSGTSSITSQATGSATILGTCGLAFPDGNTVNYGALIPNSYSFEVGLNMTNSGTVNATLFVAGNNWEDILFNDVMYANVTHYNVTAAQGYANNTGLESFDKVVTNIFDPAVTLHTYWELFADLLNPSFTGSATQTMDFTVSC